MTVAVGPRSPRSDGEEKVRGDAVFGVDLRLPGMAHARLLRSPVPAGLVISIDIAADAPLGRTGMVLFDMPLFADEYIAYEGEPLAAVVAETPELAEAAVRAIEFDIEEQVAVATPREDLEDGARLVHPQWASFKTMNDGECRAAATS